mmetsp:Transcript_66984/g.160473  ORF Transcript_66984/g.160473 Transcript_66984/m.160473 type:complete len:202 (+) Transcript_66984:349-954(+)
MHAIECTRFPGAELKSVLLHHRRPILEVQYLQRLRVCHESISVEVPGGVPLPRCNPALAIVTPPMQEDLGVRSLQSKRRRQQRRRPLGHEDAILGAKAAFVDIVQDHGCPLRACLITKDLMHEHGVSARQLQLWVRRQALVDIELLLRLLHRGRHCQTDLYIGVLPDIGHFQGGPRRQGKGRHCLAVRVRLCIQSLVGLLD